MTMEHSGETLASRLWTHGCVWRGLARTGRCGRRAQPQLQADPPGGVEVMVLSASMFQQLFRSMRVDDSVLEEVRHVHEEREARNMARLQARRRGRRCAAAHWV